MSRREKKFWALILIATTLLSGCHPMQPFYFQEDGDLSHYLDVATKIEHADVNEPRLDEVTQSRAPLSIVNPEFDEIWDLCLEEAVHIAMHNSKVVRNFGLARGLTQSAPTLIATPNSVIPGADSVVTVYDPAIVETNPGGSSGLPGVEAALADFDTQLNMSMFWDRADRPQNVQGGIFQQFTPLVFNQDRMVSKVELAKRTAAGTQLFFRNNMIYDSNNRGGRALPSDWYTDLEMEARQPLLRGAGVQVNRVPVILARIREDISLADFEANARNLASDVENVYWELYYQYRLLEATKSGRDSALVTWKKIKALADQGAAGGEADKLAQAEQQYYNFRAQVENALQNLYKIENRLRYIMGIAATDGRLIRPCTEPTTARLEFDWHDVLCEGLVRSVELRRQKWRIKQREMEMIAARNQLLPRLDAVALYRFLGLGDDLIDVPRRGINYPAPGSQAWDELTEGNYQEWRLGFEMNLPIGFRRELAGVRHVQLRLAREKAVLEEMELELSHQLTDAMQDLQGHYTLAQTNFNRRVAAGKEVEAVQAAYEHGTVTLDLLLQAQDRRAQAEIAFFRSMVDYNKAITQMHFRKGSLLEYNNVFLSEGPWPAKAYYDAHAQARQRDASYYLDYGYTRPKVISQGPVLQNENDAAIHDGEFLPYEGEPIPAPQPTPAGEMDQYPSAPLTMPMAGRSGEPTRLSSAGTTSTGTANRPSRVASQASASAGSAERFHWGELNLRAPVGATSGTRSASQPAAHLEPPTP